jgi:hypothetical protein
VSRSWDELVAAGRALVDEDALRPWRYGDLALEAAPIGGGKRADKLAKWAAEVGWDRLDRSMDTLINYRGVAAAWPAERRVDASWTAHQRLASHPERFELIKPGMTVDEAERLVAKRREEPRQETTEEPPAEPVPAEPRPGQPPEEQPVPEEQPAEEPAEEEPDEEEREQARTYARFARLLNSARDKLATGRAVLDTAAEVAPDDLAHYAVEQAIEDVKRMESRLAKLARTARRVA